MKKWLRRIRGAVGMGLTWAAGWALVGVLIELIIEILPALPMGSLVDDWVGALAVPGFLGGLVFSAVLWIAESRRRFDELSLPRFGAWGAVGGLLLGMLAAAAGVASAVFPGLWLRAAIIIGPTTLLSAVSAVGSALLFRYAARE
jgi:hypothetical protein